MRVSACGFIVVLVAIVARGPAAAVPGTPDHWVTDIRPTVNLLGTLIGARPGYQDGYDGQQPIDVSQGSGMPLLLYRENGPDWSGPRGSTARTMSRQ